MINVMLKNNHLTFLVTTSTVSDSDFCTAKLVNTLNEFIQNLTTTCYCHLVDCVFTTLKVHGIILF